FCARETASVEAVSLGWKRDSLRLFDRVLDGDLVLVEARLGIEGGEGSDNSLHLRKLSRAAGYASDLGGGQLPRAGLYDIDRSGKEFIAVLHHIYGVERGVSVAIGQIGNAAVPLLYELESVDDGRVVRISAVKIENPHDMIGYVAYVYINLLRVLAVLSRRLERNLLFLLGDCPSRCICQAQIALPVRPLPSM